MDIVKQVLFNTEDVKPEKIKRRNIAILINNSIV